MRTTFLRGAGAALAVVLTIAGGAYGDVLTPAADNVDAEPGSEGTATFFLDRDDDDDPNTQCNATGSANPTVYVTSSSPYVVIDAPGSMTIDNCGDTGGSIGFTVAANAPIDLEVTITAHAPNGTATAPNGAVQTVTKKGVATHHYPTYRDGSFTVTVVPPPPPPGDQTPPVISYSLDPQDPDGDNGWYTGDVAITWTVTEAESPDTLQKTGCLDQTVTTDGVHELSCSASSAGGSAAAVTATVKRDATAPTVALTDGPQDGGVYYFGFVPAAPGCSASDATSGLAAACGVSGYAATVGTHTVTASADDNAGNTGSAGATYEVKPWTLKGFYSPVDRGVHNTVKSGATVPLKFEAFAGDTELTSTDIVTARSKQISCGTGVPEDTVELTATGGTTLRYSDGQFIYNWQTPAKRAGTCWTVTIGFADGSSLSAEFKLK